MDYNVSLSITDIKDPWEENPTNIACDAFIYIYIAVQICVGKKDPRHSYNPWVQQREHF